MNTNYQNSLTIPRSREAKTRAAVRPVSRVVFEVTDRDAFIKTIHLCLKWMQPRAQVALPQDSWDGRDFDLSDIIGANTARAMRLDAADGSLWVARLDWPDPEAARTWVTEFFVQQSIGAVVRLGVQLTCVFRSGVSAIDITRPTVVRHVIENLSSQSDEWQLLNRPCTLNSGDIGSLCDLLYHKDRRLPVVCTSIHDDPASVAVSEAIANHVSGAAHVFALKPEASWELTRTIGKRMSVFGGATRLYWPHLDYDNEDPFQHPLWMPDFHDSKAILFGVAQRVLPWLFLSNNGLEPFPRLSLLRDVFEKEKRQSISPQNQKNNIEHEITLLKAEKEDILEERDVWIGLAQEEQSRRLALETETQRLSAEIARLTAKASALEHKLSDRASAGSGEAQVDRRLTSYEDIEDWADEVLGPHIQIHSAAAKDCRKFGHNSMLRRIEDALIIVRDFGVPFRLNGGVDRRDEYTSRLAAIGMEDTPCFANRDDAKHFDGYSVVHNGVKRILYDHIKYGNGYDNANQIRIYYFWDETLKLLVVGKMPSHLKNNLTN